MSSEDIRILVVDDDDDVVHGTAHLLTRAGYVTATASNGVEAMRTMPAFHPHLVLSDRDMPEMDGVELCRRIKADPALVGVLVVLISGTYTQTEEQAEGLESGADGYIPRPIANRELLARVESYARISHLQTHLAAALSERRRAEEELRQAHQVLEGILSAIPVRIFWKDHSLKYLGCNRAFARDAGCAEPKDIIGKDDFQMGWRQQAELYRDNDQEVIASGRPRLLIEEPQTTPAGDTIWILTSKVPLCDSTGKISGVVGAYMDVTERKRMEEEKQALAEKLRKEQKLAAVGTLACGMGHEINNPIMGIINYAQLIKDRLRGKDGNVEEFADEIAIEAKRIAGIVRKLSAFATRDIAIRVSVPVTDLIESALTPLRDALAHDRIALEVDLPDNLPAVACDREQIAQVLTSLLSNAQEALNEKCPEHDDDKKIIVSAECGMRNAELKSTEAKPSPKAEIGSDRVPKAEIRITVEDHGAGITLDVIDHIFEPFFTTRDKSIGAGNIGKGMGLFVSHATIQEHGGEMSVESEPGQWTRFHVDLPVAGEQGGEIARREAL